MSEHRAVCPNCGGLDATADNDGVTCYSCGFFSHEEIDRFYGR